MRISNPPLVGHRVCVVAPIAWFFISDIQRSLKHAFVVLQTYLALVFSVCMWMTNSSSCRTRATSPVHALFDWKLANRNGRDGKNWEHSHQRAGYSDTYTSPFTTTTGFHGYYGSHDDVSIQWTNVRRRTRLLLPSSTGFMPESSTTGATLECPKLLHVHGGGSCSDCCQCLC